jgi:hypothetical protein
MILNAVVEVVVAAEMLDKRDFEINQMQTMMAMPRSWCLRK